MTVEEKNIHQYHTYLLLSFKRKPSAGSWKATRTLTVSVLRLFHYRWCFLTNIRSSSESLLRAFSSFGSFGCWVCWASLLCVSLPFLAFLFVYRLLFVLWNSERGHTASSCQRRPVLKVQSKEPAPLCSGWRQQWAAVRHFWALSLFLCLRRTTLQRLCIGMMKMDISRTAPSAATAWRSFCVATRAAAGLSAHCQIMPLVSGQLEQSSRHPHLPLLLHSTGLFALTVWISSSARARSSLWSCWTRGPATCASLIRPTGLWFPERTGASACRNYSPTTVAFSLWVNMKYYYENQTWERHEVSTQSILNEILF